MIVLPVISQKNYIINNDSLVCYSHNENRTIALIMLNGERDSLLLNNANNYIDSLQINFNNLNKEFNHLDTITKLCINNNTNLNKELIIKNKQLTTRKYIILSSIGLNGILLLILLL